MKIAQSTVAMNATHHFTSEREFNYDSNFDFQAVFGNVSEMTATRSDKAKRETRMLLMLENLIQRILDLVSGKTKAQVIDVREIMLTAETGSGTGQEKKGTLSFKWATKTTETFREHESTDFSSRGVVKTTDGRSLDFNLELRLCRDFECTREETRQQVSELRDPLVINFDGKACELSGKRFTFDLDIDGQQESISALAESSGFLAIDRNQDGLVTDGGELFGALTGNGFADLAAFDKDRNGWIDESDNIFPDLRIWRHDGKGLDTLKTLREEGIGALYLGFENTEFQLTDEECHLLAQIRSSGVYLSENGSARTMQQVDFSI